MHAIIGLQQSDTEQINVGCQCRSDLLNHLSCVNNFKLLILGINLSPSAPQQINEAITIVAVLNNQHPGNMTHWGQFTRAITAVVVDASIDNDLVRFVSKHE